MLNIYERECVSESIWKSNNFFSSANGRLSFDRSQRERTSITKPLQFILLYYFTYFYITLHTFSLHYITFTLFIYVC